MENKDILSALKECNTYEYFHFGRKRILSRGVFEIYDGLKFKDLDAEYKKVLEERKDGENTLLNYMEIDNETIVYIGFINYQGILTRTIALQYTGELVFTLSIEFPYYWQGIVGKELKTREDIEKFLNGK